MEVTIRVFISWSGDRSKHVAEAFHDWLPSVIQSVKPWMSATDIDAGERWSQSVQTELKDAMFGIICVTTENQVAPLLLFAAGALAKTTVDTFVCPYLIGMEQKDLTSGPLTQFQCKTSNMEDTFALICSINSALKTVALPEAQLRKTFELWWPQLEEKLNQVPVVSSPVKKRQANEMIEEILISTREIKRILQESGGLLTGIDGSASGLAGLLSEKKERNGLEGIITAMGLLNEIAKAEKRSAAKSTTGVVKQPRDM